MNKGAKIALLSLAGTGLLTLGIWSIMTVKAATTVPADDTQVKARLDDMVKVGWLTQAEADSMYQQYQTQLQQTPMAGMMGFGHGDHEHLFGL